MQRLQTFNQDDLLDALTDQYHHYRKLVGLGGSEEEFLACRHFLLAILEELNYRRKFWETTTERDLSFDRRPDQ